MHSKAPTITVSKEVMLLLEPTIPFSLRQGHSKPAMHSKASVASVQACVPLAGSHPTSRHAPRAIEALSDKAGWSLSQQ